MLPPPGDVSPSLEFRRELPEPGDVIGARRAGNGRRGLPAPGSGRARPVCVPTLATIQLLEDLAVGGAEPDEGLAVAAAIRVGAVHQ
jgi:hypothetical protein